MVTRSVAQTATTAAAKQLSRQRCPPAVSSGRFQRATDHFAPPSRSRSSHVAQFKLATSAEINKRQSDLSTRMRYLTNFWYAASFSKKISHKKAVATLLLDTNILIWRDDHSGEVVCMTATHPDTLEDLSEKDAHLTVYTTAEGTKQTAINVQGVLYSATTGMPVQEASAEDSGDSARPVSDSQGHLEIWSCVEKGGFVWMFFGDKNCPMRDRPHIPWVKELNNPGFRGVHGEVYVKASHWMVIENVIDMAHVPYVHAGTVGDHAAFVDIDIKTTPTSLHFDFPIENHTAEGEDPIIRVETKASAFLPSTSFIHFNVPLKFSFGPLKIDTSWNPVTINSVVPIDEHTTCIRFCNLRDFFPFTFADPVIAQGMKNILGEDKVILEAITPYAVTTEISVKADIPQLTLRRMRERYIGAGASVPPGKRGLHSMPQWTEDFAERLRAAKKDKAHKGDVTTHNTV